MTDDMAGVAGEIIASYEARVASVEQINEAAHETLEASRRRRDGMRSQLREALARVASLRKRDFDAMMQGLLIRQEAREQAVREAVREYLAEQRALAAALKEAVAGGVPPRSRDVRALLAQMAATREAREQEVKRLLADFQSEQEKFAQALQHFLSADEGFRVREFKATLETIQARREGCSSGPHTTRGPSEAQQAKRAQINDS